MIQKIRKHQNFLSDTLLTLYYCHGIDKEMNKYIVTRKIQEDCFKLSNNLPHMYINSTEGIKYYFQDTQDLRFEFSDLSQQINQLMISL